MRKNKFLTPMQDAQLEKPSAERRRRFHTLDDLIRSLGYTIKSRPKNGGDPIWERNGIEFGQADIVLREQLPGSPDVLEVTIINDEDDDGCTSADDDDGQGSAEGWDDPAEDA